MKRLFSCLLGIALFSSFPLNALCQVRDAQATFKKAQWLCERGEVRESLSLFLALRESAPGYRATEVQRYICKGYEKLGEFDRALEEYEVYVKKFPWARDRVKILMRMVAIAEVAMEDLKRAWQYLSMAYESEVLPQDMPALLFNKGYLLEKMGRGREAIPIYQRLLKEYPDSLGAHWAEERLEALQKPAD